jgi:DNA-binding MarR family transcriptional regulator
VDAGRTYELLERLANLLRSEERRIGQERGLASVHLHALGYLERANRYSDTLVALAEYLSITKGTASQTVAVLSERGLLKSRRDAQDGRKIHLGPTAEGRRLLAACRPVPLLRQACAELGVEPGQIESALEALLRALQRANRSRAFGVCGSCRHLLRTAGRTTCGLTGEPLSPSDTQRLCREHEAPAAVGRG